jgi:hypothetical protein
MKGLLLILILVFASSCFGQETFIISETISIDSFSKLDKVKFKIDKNNIFEDSIYIVSKSCSGEWGGSVKFKNKRSGIVYSAAATCPVTVTKLNGSYIVTNTLAHLRGSTEIIEIRNPDAMTVFELPKSRKKKGNVIVRYVGDDESKSTKGIQPFVDSIGVLTLATFPFHEHLYHIVTDFEKTYLTKVIDGNFVSLETISNESLWTYNPEVFVTLDKHYIVFFDNEKASGYLDVFENKIKVVRRK